MPTDLNNLPPLPSLSEEFPEALARLKQQYHAATQVYPLPSHPETFLLEQLAYEGGLLSELVFEEGSQNLLAFAKGARLDHLGAFLDVARLPSQPAQTQLRFNLSVHSSEILLPAGIEVLAADGQSLFSTTTAVSVAVGITQVDVIAACQMIGTVGNGFQPGEIKQLVSPRAFVDGVINLTVSSGGADKEDDERYRQRIRLAPAKFSTAGSQESYIFWAKSAHPSIVDIRVYGSPDSPGTVLIYPLLEGGQVPDVTMLSTLYDVVSDKKVRPMTDEVVVLPPIPVAYSIEVTLQVYSDQAALAESARTAAVKQLDTLARQWQNRLGRDIVPEELVLICQGIAGVYRAVVTAPAFTQIAHNHFPKFSRIAVTAVLSNELS